MATAWTIPAGNLVNFYDGTHDIDTDTLKMALFVDGYDDTTTTYGTTNEATGDGYTAGGATLANVSLSESGGVVTFDCDDVEWDATGGSLSARWAVIYNDTDASKTVMFVSDLNDGTAADLTATNDTFTVSINASGVATFEQT